MRLELKMRNGPLVWLAFLVFIGVYVAGFDAWLSERQIGRGMGRGVAAPGARGATSMRR